MEFGNIQFVFSYDDFRVRLFASTFFEKFDINYDSLPFHLDIAIHEKYTEWLHQTYVQLTFWSFDSNFSGQYPPGFRNPKKNKRNPVTLAKTLKEKGGKYFISNTQLHSLPFKFL